MKGSKEALPLQNVSGVGTARARLFAKLGISSIDDAVTHLPLRYEDRSDPMPISDLSPGAMVTVSGTIVSAQIVRLRGRNLSICEVIISDQSGYLKLKWFNQPYMLKNFNAGLAVIAAGLVRRNTRDMPPMELENPEYEIVPRERDAGIHTRRVVPFYGLTEGISQKQFRKIMFSIIHEHASGITDPLPPDIARKHRLPGLQESIRQLHFPERADHLAALNSGTSIYHRRVAFDELFLLELGMALLKRNAAGERGICFESAGRLKGLLLEQLPFGLTDAQKRVLEEIGSDMRSPRPMQRLIQGDVGCGKTIVAVAAMLDAVESGYQAALMAPTTILAEQHYLNIQRLVGQLGPRLALLSGASEVQDALSADIVIGTHALIQERVKYGRLGLAVIDEQHKFGVVQRADLRKKGLDPDVMVMTATPIPRSLALTVYGDFDCSVIDELPPGRKPAHTRWTSSADREEIFGLLKREIGAGRQAYVVYPAIEESEKTDLKAAIQGREALQKKFPEYRVGLLHGRMRPEERERVMDLFKKREIDVLVSTTVIEVGVDVPNASVMVIVHAERFGLSQLHQLRGRVGRGAERSHCILIAYPPVGDDARRRLDIMEQTDDGFRISREDLAIRGPGEFLGTRQAGLPDLKNSDIIRDEDLLTAAKTEAFSLIDNDPGLKEYPFLKKRLDVFWKGRIDLFRTA